MGFFFLLLHAVLHRNTPKHTWRAAAWRLWFLPELLRSDGLHLKAPKPPSSFAVKEKPTIISRRPRFALVYGYTNWAGCGLTLPSCFGEHHQRRGARHSLFFFFTPPSPSSILLLLRPSFLTSLIWNPSSNSGRRGRTHQLLMYSQCREKREGRLANVWNTPAEISGACFCNLVELFLEHSGRFFAHPWTANLSLFSQAPGYGSCCFGCQSSSLLGILRGKVSYRALQINPK